MTSAPGSIIRTIWIECGPSVKMRCHGVAWETEARILRRDGHYRWFLIRSNPHRDAHEHIVRWYSTGTDIEDRKQAEDALRRAQVDLQRERDRLKLLLELTNQVISNLEL